MHVLFAPSLEVLHHAISLPGRARRLRVLSTCMFFGRARGTITTTQSTRDHFARADFARAHFAGAHTFARYCARSYVEVAVLSAAPRVNS